MENLSYTIKTDKNATGTKAWSVVGVVASGDLEVLVERGVDLALCQVEIATAAHGFSEIWKEVVQDFVEESRVGGLRISIHDGGARPDTVRLRMAQGVRLMEVPA